jgi:hypothetical protein
MSSTTAFTTAGKQGFLQAQFPVAHTFKIALFNSTATNGSGTAVYNSTNEVSGTGYTGGGATLTGVAVSSSGTTAWWSASNPSWTVATFTAESALIYDSSDAIGPNATLCVLDFGGNQNVAAGTFTIQFPAAAAATALIRLT